jgi:hypothetical protein
MATSGAANLERWMRRHPQIVALLTALALAVIGALGGE